MGTGVSTGVGVGVGCGVGVEVGVGVGVDVGIGVAVISVVDSTVAVGTEVGTAVLLPAAFPTFAACSATVALFGVTSAAVELLASQPASEMTMVKTQNIQDTDFMNFLSAVIRFHSSFIFGNESKRTATAIPKNPPNDEPALNAPIPRLRKNNTAIQWAIFLIIDFIVA